jgi:hypothetical protein
MERILLVLWIFSSAAFAEGDEKLWPEDKPKNFCLDPAFATNNENLAKEHPGDERLVKLVALRSGLCNLVLKNIVPLNTAIDIFDAEKENEMQKRLQEGQTNKGDIVL